MRDVLYFDNANFLGTETTLVASKQGLVYFGRKSDSLQASVFSLYPNRMMVHDPKRLAPYVKELTEYLHHERKYFDLPLDYDNFGTPVQRLVLDVVRKIPYGMTCTYSEITAAIRQADSVQTVAHTIALNPLPIFIPAHRVILANSVEGGKEIHCLDKQKLLDFERSNMHAIS